MCFFFCNCNTLTVWWPWVIERQHINESYYNNIHMLVMICLNCPNCISVVISSIIKFMDSGSDCRFDWGSAALLLPQRSCGGLYVVDATCSVTPFCVYSCHKAFFMFLNWILPFLVCRDLCLQMFSSWGDLQHAAGGDAQSQHQCGGGGRAGAQPPGSHFCRYPHTWASQRQGAPLSEMSLSPDHYSK